MLIMSSEHSGALNPDSGRRYWGGGGVTRAARLRPFAAVAFVHPHFTIPGSEAAHDSGDTKQTVVMAAV
jgi:hypothetical protein